MSKSDKRYTEGPLKSAREPGPREGYWHIIKSTDTDYRVLGCTFLQMGESESDEAKANAELWSLAPELARALRRMVKIMDDLLTRPDLFEEIRAARALLDRLEPGTPPEPKTIITIDLGEPCEKCGSTDGWQCQWCKDDV